MTDRTSVSATLHVRGEITAKSHNGSDWLSLGGVGVFFDDTAAIERTIAALRDLAARMTGEELLTYTRI